MLKVEHLSKKFGDLEVLKDISLNVEEGEVVTIIGPSGSGKSTFLRCINQLETPTSGDISYQEILLPIELMTSVGSGRKWEWYSRDLTYFL